MTSNKLSQSFLAGALLLAPLAAAACAQPYGFIQAPPVVAAAPQPAPRYSDDQLDQLLGPIALYPDPLLAQVLPASTYPAEVVAAAQWTYSNPTITEAAIAAQPWEPSVKAVVHYPTVLQFMGSNIQWTQAVGAAFINQQQDVMDAIQRLRYQAQAAGNLATTPQQQVIVADNCISIEPCTPDLIYVPVYDPLWAFRRHELGEVIVGGGIRFSIGLRLGAWLDNDCDWNHHWVAVGAGWNHGWRDDRPVEGHPFIGNRPDAGREVVRPAISKPWAHNPGKPGPVVQMAPERRPQLDERRGYAPPAAAHEAERAPEVRAPAHDARPVAPAPSAVREVRPEPGAFGPVQSRGQTERASDRGQQSQAPAQTHAAPPAQQARPAAPAPAPTAFERPSSGAASGGGSGGNSAQAQSDRGHQSMKH